MSERKDIDAIVGATVKLEESLNKRISELEKKINERTSIGGKFINKVVEDWFKDITLTPLGREIAELKEQIIRAWGVIEHNKEECMENRIVKEVLQDHIKAHKFIADQGSVIKIMDKWIEHLNEALEKLDGKGKLEKQRQEILKEVPNFIFLSWNRKDSGGEKEMGYEVATTSIVKGQHPSPTNSKPPIVSEHVSGVNLENNVTVTETMLMDLTEVTVIALSGKAFLVLKKGYQKWIPYSQLYDVEERFEDGQFLQNIMLNEKAEKWMYNKPWEKFKAVKNRG